MEDKEIGEKIANLLFSILGVFQIVFILLKLIKLINWSWIIVWLPTIILGGFILFVFIYIFIYMFFSWSKNC